MRRDENASKVEEKVREERETEEEKKLKNRLERMTCEIL